MTRFLTKSRFKLALDCPTKLYYAGRANEYANANLDDPFLAALAKGGFQVGELAKCYYPGGHDIKTLNKDQAVQQTTELLKQKNVVIFEAAICFENLFIRVDILEKIGNTLNLIEVKSKSANPNTFADELWGKREFKNGEYKLNGTWKSYIYDVAFQAHVIKNAFPKFKLSSYLMCADKTATASMEGLNQKFVLKTDDKGRSYAETKGDVTPMALGTELLCKLDVSEVVSIIHNDEEMSERFEGMGFTNAVKHFATSYEEDKQLAAPVGTHCKGCEFRTHAENLKCGFDECWSRAHGMTAEELQKPFVFDVWNYRSSAIKLEEGKHLLEELEEDDFKIDDSKVGLSVGNRQWLQVEKEKNGDKTSFLNKTGLKLEFEKWQYPLHMIDFETCMVAIPFNKGRRPYEQVAFQFSHHIIYEDGTHEHKNEFINTEPGVFPNFLFVRALKKALEVDEGTIFRYSNHENTVLCQIRDQLLASNEKDKDKLISFIESITVKKDQWEGERKMVDLLELVKSYYYNPATGGSNSIKYVLPAILNESSYLKTKYSKPIYHSKNFISKKWIELNGDGTIADPYKSLPPVFDKYDFETLELLMSDSDIQDGGAALTAYAMMQFTEMSASERKKITDALLRYCELDTFAMVLIWEFWAHEIGVVEKTKRRVA